MIANRHKDKLKENLSEYKQSIGSNNYHLYPNKGGYNWINDSFKDKIVENATMTEFNLLYPNVLIKLYDEIYPITSEKDNFEKVRYFIQNRNNIKLTSDYLSYKTFINGFYGKLQMPVNISGRIICSLLSDYMYMVYDELLSVNNNILYIDTDSIVHIGDIDFIDLNLTFTQKPIDIIFQAKKRYVMNDNNTILVRGWGKNDKRPQELISEMKSLLRDRKLLKIGI